ncbi:hypothetical protein [Peijinzhouia sedimentorum]
MNLNRSKFLSSSNWFFWVLFVFILRGLVLVFFLIQSYQLNPDRIISGIGIQQNDYYMFLGVVDNYFKTGVYELYEGSNEAFAGRLPGYSMPYLFLRHIFPQSISLFIIISLQILLSVISVYLLALLSIKWFRTENYFISIIIIFSISTYTSIYDLFTLAESFSVSAVIFGFYLLTIGLKRQSKIFLLYSGVFVAWAIFLRPFLGLLILFIPIIIFVYLLKSHPHIRLINNVKRVLIFAIPFIVFESVWIGRNYIEFNRFIPLETSLSESYGDFGLYGKAALGIRKLINSYGGDSAEFRTGSDAWWFHHAEDSELDSFNFPEWIFEIEEVNRNTLIEIRNLYHLSIKNQDSELGRRANLKAESLALHLSDNIKSNAPFRYYLVNNLLRTGRFIFTNGTYLLPLPSFSEMTILQKLIKLFYYAMYFTVLITGLTGILLRTFNVDKWSDLPFMLSVALFLSLVIAIIFVGDIIENRYFISMYPFLLVFGIYAIDRFRKLLLG